MKRTIALGIFVTILLFAATTLRAQDPLVGTWKLNVAKSKYIPGPGPKSLTRTVTPEGDKMKYSNEGVAADGSAIAYGTTVTLDGKDYPVTGSGVPGGADTIAITKLSPTSYDATFKKSGEPILTSKVRISKDGKVTTSHLQSAPGKGSVNNTAVYDKQ